MQRVLALDGGINFRDFGGYPTADGRRVKWRKLLRSGHLAKLSDAAHAEVEALGLALVCDFRLDREQEKRPSRLPAIDRRIRLNIWPKSARSVADMMRAKTTDDVDDGEILARQNAVYREFAVDFAAEYATMFRHILDAAGRPVLIHCTAGKDRTGLGAALILLALGVPADTVMDDYLISNACPHLRAEILEIARRTREIAASEESRFLHLLGARAESLNAAFDAIREVAGSIDGYLSNNLGLTAADLQRLREGYLESP